MLLKSHSEKVIINFIIVSKTEVSKRQIKIFMKQVHQCGSKSSVPHSNISIIAGAFKHTSTRLDKSTHTDTNTHTQVDRHTYTHARTHTHIHAHFMDEHTT